jgi:putative cardiolipin synthase
VEASVTLLLRGLMLTAALWLSGCASLPVHYERIDSHALQDTSETRLGRAGRGALQAHAGQNAFRPLPDGLDALLARIHLAEAAERSLDLMYYKWNNDTVGKHLANALLRAADRGVRVRVLIDDAGTSVDDNNLMALDGHSALEVRLFNPSASRGTRMLELMTSFGRLNRRMHNKAFIADNQRAILGGRNIGDEYFEALGDGNFADLDVVMAGPVVGEVSKAFDLYWNSPVVYPITALTGKRHEIGSLDALRAELAAFVASQTDTPYTQAARARADVLLNTAAEGVFWGKAHVLYDDPSKITRDAGDREGTLLPQFSELGLSLDKELTIVSPYFIPGDAGIAWLGGLVRRGLRVTVLTNSLASTDVPAVHASYKRYRDRLVDAGVRLYELKPDASDVVRASRDRSRAKEGSRASLHAKTFLFDRQAMFIGSLNLDPRSIQLNTEIGIVCESPALTESMLSRLEPLIDRIAWRVERATNGIGTPQLVWVETRDQDVQRHSSEPDVSGWQRFKVWLLGLLPIESQL